MKGLFGFFYVKQYANNPYHQFSCHITIKLSKYATKRNKIKRLVMNYLRDSNASSLAIGGQFYKVFIVLNKNDLLRLQALLDTDASAYVKQAFQVSFTSFQSFLCSKT